MTCDTVVLEWTFSPPDYFEHRFQINRDGYSIVVENGTAEARIDPAIYDDEHKIRDRLHDELNNHFLGVQLLTHQPYDLSKSSMYRLYADGRRDVNVFVESAVIVYSGGTPDIVITDSKGQVVSDTRQDRIESKRELAALSASCSSRDSLAASLLASYHAAVTDPENEFLHLYEIRDALSKHFGGESKTRLALGISNTKWSDFGRLTNNTPLKQSRHRGKFAGETRTAADTELQEARDIAREFIEAYLRYLQQQDAPTNSADPNYDG
ncbi:hypothetical protein [Methylocaldum sp. RMAD-M]|jgi:hypothetical protein|uniref:hypothetical protein n=1 Tax=Methylocaldum sp. RMAD-M TaxID=2806557 RepID=UPI001AE27884|nr:hypothetical protein [Methylocaldum sp. RMAD-M]MBP1152763.1 hypothetical protein [Methylocaldum sp. RMAD-M]